MKYTLIAILMLVSLSANACIEFNEPWLQFIMKPNQKFYDAHDMQLWAKEGNNIKGVHGIMSGKLVDNTLYACDGSKVAKLSGDSIYDETGSLIYRLRGGNVEDNHGTVKFKVSGNSIYDAHGMLYGKLDMY